MTGTSPIGEAGSSSSAPPRSDSPARNSIATASGIYILPHGDQRPEVDPHARGGPHDRAAGRRPSARSRSASPSAQEQEQEQAAFDKALAEIEKDCCFATLVRALASGTPDHVLAACVLIAEGTTVGADKFFEDHPTRTMAQTNAHGATVDVPVRVCVIDALISTLIDSYRRIDRPPFAECGGRTVDASRLFGEIQCFEVLLAACHDERANPEVRKVAAKGKYKVASTRLFLRLAAALPQETDQDEAVKLIGGLIPDIGHLVDFLEADMEAGLPHKVHERLHSLCARLVDRLPHKNLARGVECAWQKVVQAESLPTPKQQAAFKAAVESIGRVPPRQFAQIYPMDHPLVWSAWEIFALDSEVIGKSAADVIDAARHQDWVIQAEVRRVVVDWARLEGPDGKTNLEQISPADRDILVSKIFDPSFVVCASATYLPDLEGYVRGDALVAEWRADLLRLTLPLESVSHSRVTNWLAWPEPQTSLARTASG